MFCIPMTLSAEPKVSKANTIQPDVKNIVILPDQGHHVVSGNNDPLPLQEGLAHYGKI